MTHSYSTKKYHVLTHGSCSLASASNIRGIQQLVFMSGFGVVLDVEYPNYIVELRLQLTCVEIPGPYSTVPLYS